MSWKIISNANKQLINYNLFADIKIIILLYKAEDVNDNLPNLKYTAMSYKIIIIFHLHRKEICESLLIYILIHRYTGTIDIVSTDIVSFLRGADKLLIRFVPIFGFYMGY